MNTVSDKHTLRLDDRGVRKLEYTDEPLRSGKQSVA